MSSSDEKWNELYANKKNEEWWMKSVVLTACIVIILMSGTMAQKGVQSLQKSLEDGIISINYAGDLLTKAEFAVGELADGLASFQTDVLGIIERTNTGLCPRFKPEGFCQREFEVQSCDFTIQVTYERDIEIDKLDVNTTIDASYNYTVDISEVADNMKDKIGSDERLNLAEVLFPTSPTIYPSLIDFFSRNWTSVDKLSDFAAKINSFATMASETGDRIETLEWLFFLAVAFNIIVGLLAMYMIVHVCVGQKFPSSLKCVQPRVLFPFFIICVSLAFIFATVFLITSMALSDTCVNDPNKRILSMVKDYMGDGLAADYVTDFIQHWFSRCNKEPVSMQKDQAFLNNAQKILQQFDGAMDNITESVIDFCETTDTELFIDMTATSMKYLCGVLGLTLDVREVFQCKTWMPLYYNTMYNVVCYNGIDGMWTIAATQLTTVLMACIVLTFRAVFFDIEPMERDDENEEVVDSVDALDGQIQNDGEC